MVNKYFMVYIKFFNFKFGFYVFRVGVGIVISGFDV